MNLLFGVKSNRSYVFSRTFFDPVVLRVGLATVSASNSCIFCKMRRRCRLCPIASMPALVPYEPVDRGLLPNPEFASLPNILYKTKMYILPLLILSSFASIYVPINKIGVDCLILDELLEGFEEEVSVL